MVELNSTFLPLLLRRVKQPLPERAIRDVDVMTVGMPLFQARVSGLVSTCATICRSVRFPVGVCVFVRHFWREGAPSDHLDVDSHAGSSCDPLVPGNQSCLQLTGQGYITGVVRCQIPPQLPDIFP